MARSIVARRTDFAFRLLAALEREQRDRNVFVSPSSIYDAVTVVGFGAAGNTRQELAQALGWAGLSDDEIGDGVAALQAGRRALGEGVQIAEAAALFVDRTVALSPEIERRARRGTAAEVVLAQLLDGSGDEILNDWVHQHTRGKIPAVVGPDFTARLAVATAVHFDGRWQDPFPVEDTRDHIFRRPDGDTLCRMMWRTASLAADRPLRLLLDDERCRGARIPYRGDRLACYALKPTRGTTLAQLCAALDGADFRRLLPRFEATPLPVGLPRLDVDCAVGLNEPLVALGVRDLFSAELGDLSRLGAAPGVRNLYVDQALHRARLEVDEAGTVAAAATVASTRAGGIVQPLVFDRPFLCAIVDEQTEDLLFLGALTSPHDGPPRAVPDPLLRQRAVMRQMPWYEED